MATGSRRGSRSIRTREQVIDAAFAVIERDGIDRLTMQKVAAHLGVGVMTLYTYVASKDDLLDALAVAVQTRAFDSMPTPGDTTTWQDDLIAVFTRTHDLLLEHPAVAFLLLRSGRTYAAASTERFLAAIERIFDKMHRDGIEPIAAARTFITAQLYVAGFVLRTLERSRGTDTDRASTASWANRLHGLDRVAYPNLVASADGFLTSASHAQLRFGLDAILGGCAAAVAAPDTIVSA